MLRFYQCCHHMPGSTNVVTIFVPDSTNDVTILSVPGSTNVVTVFMPGSTNNVVTVFVPGSANVVTMNHRVSKLGAENPLMR